MVKDLVVAALLLIGHLQATDEENRHFAYLT